MYGNKSIRSVNELRSKIYWQYSRKNEKVPDLSLLPPWASSLKTHTARAHYIARIWKQAAIPFQNIEPFTNYGWLADGAIDWVEQAYPTDVKTLFLDKMNSDSTENLDENDDENDDENIDSDIDDIEEYAV